MVPVLVEIAIIATEGLGQVAARRREAGHGRHHVAVGTGFRAPSLTQIGYTVADNRVATDVNGNVVPAVTRLTQVPVGTPWAARIALTAPLPWS